MTKLEEELLSLIENNNIIEENYNLWFYLNERRILRKERLASKISSEKLEELIEISKPKPPKPPLLRIIKEGTYGTCPECKSTEMKRFIWFGKSIGCINPNCKKYYS